MYARAKWLLSSLLVLLFSVSVAGAQEYGQQQYGQSRPAFAQQQLDQMLAPIALYPDALLSQILMAATYPGEVVEAARWSRSNPDLNGDRAVRAAERIDWDPSVKSLVAFPQILTMMDEKLDWTEDVGDAFLDQREQVMDTVQYLRSQAYSAGNLSSSDQFRVDRQDAIFTISFTNAQMAYVPYYDPLIVYGTWWWPAYRPVYWAPWPGYHARPGFARGYAWGPGIAVSRSFFFGAPDWHRRTVNIVNVNNYYYRPAHVNARADFAAGAPHAWQHDATHRQDVPRREASLRQPRVEAAPEARRDVREQDSSPRHERGALVNTPTTAQPEVRTVPSRPIAAESAPRGAPERSAHIRGQEPRGQEPRGQDSRGQDARGQDSRGFEGRGESRRPETRGDSGNRPAYQQAVAGINQRPAVERAPVAAPVASQPQVHVAPAPAPVQAQAAPARPAAEQRPAVGREREHANNRPAPAAADNTSPAQNSGRGSR